MFNSRIDTSSKQRVLNCYVTIDGVIRPHKFDTEGLYYFDGQFWSLKMPKYWRKENV